MDSSCAGHADSRYPREKVVENVALGLRSDASCQFVCVRWGQRWDKAGGDNGSNRDDVVGARDGQHAVARH